MSDKNSEKSQPKQNVSRREFLKMAGLAAASIGLIGCTPKENSNLPTTESPTSPKPEILTPQTQQVIVDYSRMDQTIYVKPASDGVSEIVKCDPPQILSAENREGFPSNFELFDWSERKLPEITIKGNTLPVLTSKPELNPDARSFLEKWYEDPQLVDKQLETLNLPPPPGTIEVLVLDYRTTRNNYWEQTPSGKCEQIFDNQPLYEPKSLFQQMTDFIRENTRGAITFEPVFSETLTEENFPLTENPALANPELINYYQRSIDHQMVAKLAVESGISTVFVFTGPSAGMYESTTWTEKESGKIITIFGLNYDRSITCAMETWLHYLEDQILINPDLRDIYLKCVGRNEEFSILPEGNSDTEIAKNVKALNNGTIYASMGMGTIHIPPNAVAQYQYDSPLRVMLPGHEFPIDSTFWSKNDNGYFAWWLKSLPRGFFSAVARIEDRSP